MNPISLAVLELQIDSCPELPVRRPFCERRIYASEETLLPIANIIFFALWVILDFMWVKEAVILIQDEPRISV